MHKLRLNGLQHAALISHLFPGDGKEAIAFALCGYSDYKDEYTYLIHDLYLYPHQDCINRTKDRVVWSPELILPLIEKCRHKDWRLLKVHCHPAGWADFSTYDDQSDTDLALLFSEWTGKPHPVMSTVMLPDGALFGRTIDGNGQFTPLKSVVVTGNELLLFLHEHLLEKQKVTTTLTEDTQLRTKQAFGDATVSLLSNLKIGVVGCSGTGSIVAELLGRLGVGHLIMVDPDKVEYKNLNRILNTTIRDAEMGSFKVDVLKAAIEQNGNGTKVTAIPLPLESHEAYRAIGSCDMVFGCMDTIDGRQLLNRIATFFTILYLDIGIRLDADGSGGINEVMGRVDCLIPGLSSLLTRDRYTEGQLRAADLIKQNPAEYEKQVRAKYIREVRVDRPAVISTNMFFSSQAVNEMLARLHPFRTEPNYRFAEVTYSIAGFLLSRETENSFQIDRGLAPFVGRGIMTPPLNAPLLISKL